MNRISEKIEKDITIQSNTVLTGMIVGNIEIKNSAEFYVYGTVTGEININKNSKAIIHGIVTGSIFNNGECEIYGMINGNLKGNLNTYKIDPKASINHG